MNWSTALLTSDIRQLLSRENLPAHSGKFVALERIREAMREAVADYEGRGSGELKLHIAGALDIYDLWYLRGDMLALIAINAGEATASRKTAQISAMFKGLLPKGMASRPSPLSN